MPTSESSSRRSTRSWSTTSCATGASATTSSSPCSNGRSPLVLTERNDHLDRLEQRLAASVRHLVVLRAGHGQEAAAGRRRAAGGHPTR